VKRLRWLRRLPWLCCSLGDLIPDPLNHPDAVLLPHVRYLDTEPRTCHEAGKQRSNSTDFTVNEPSPMPLCQPRSCRAPSISTCGLGIHRIAPLPISHPVRQAARRPTGACSRSETTRPCTMRREGCLFNGWCAIVAKARRRAAGLPEAARLARAELSLSVPSAGLQF
jgi:hypothetical protein